jgi:hypothetical protein
MPKDGSPHEIASASTPSPPRPSCRWWQNRWELCGWILFAGLLVGFFPFALKRLTRLTSSDFWLFYESANYVVQHGTRDIESKFIHYLPSLEVAFAGLSWMPLFWAAVAWIALMITGWLCLMAAVDRYLLCDDDAVQARRSILCAGLLVLPLFLDHLCIGAFHVLMVWWMVAGLGRISQNKSWSGGIILGLAIWIKMLPLVGVGYLILKRKWLPAALAIVTVVVVDLALSLPMYGPQTTWKLHRQWIDNEVFGVKNQLLTDPNPVGDDRNTNQSLMVVMRHTLTHMGEGTVSDHEEAVRRGKPRYIGSVAYGGLRPNVAIANLTPDQLQTAYTVVMLLLILGIAIYCRQPSRVLLPRQWATEISLIVLSTLWFSPLVWSYHPTAALPALAVIFARAPRRPKLVLAVTALWMISLTLMGSPLARAMGVTFWMNLLSGVFLVWTAYGEAPTLAEEQIVPSAALLASKERS